VRQSKRTRARKRKKKTSAISRTRCEARRRAYGGGELGGFEFQSGEIRAALLGLKARAAA